MQRRKTFKFNETKDDTFDKPDEVSQLVYKLANEVRLKRKARDTKTSTWKPFFERLVDNYGMDRVSTVLDWYIRHMGDAKIPRAFSARAFSNVFSELEKKMQLSKDSIVVSDIVQKICKNAQHYNWPNGTDQLYPLMAQRSHEAYSIFYESICKEETQTALKKEKLTQLWKHLRSMVLTEPVLFLHTWIKSVNNQISPFSDYSGNIMSHTWSLDNPKFHNRMIGYCRAYCGNGSLWYDIVQCLKKQGVV